MHCRVAMKLGAVAREAETLRNERSVGSWLAQAAGKSPDAAVVFQPRRGAGVERQATAASVVDHGDQLIWDRPGQRGDRDRWDVEIPVQGWKDGMRPSAVFSSAWRCSWRLGDIWQSWPSER